MKETITIAELQELRACPSAQEAFLEEFGEDTIVPLSSLLEKIQQRKMIDWEGWLLGQNVELTEALLHHGADVHADDGCALQLSSKGGRIEVVKLLLDHGADVHVNNDEALRWASWRGYTEIVILLLDHGADVDVGNGFPLYLASGHPETEAVLREAMKQVA